MLLNFSLQRCIGTVATYLFEPLLGFPIKNIAYPFLLLLFYNDYMQFHIGFGLDLFMGTVSIVLQHLFFSQVLLISSFPAEVIQALER